MRTGKQMFWPTNLFIKLVEEVLSGVKTLDDARKMLSLAEYNYWYSAFFVPAEVEKKAKEDLIISLRTITFMSEATEKSCLDKIAAYRTAFNNKIEQWYKDSATLTANTNIDVSEYIATKGQMAVDAYMINNKMVDDIVTTVYDFQMTSKRLLGISVSDQKTYTILSKIKTSFDKLQTDLYQSAVQLSAEFPFQEELKREFIFLRLAKY